MTFDESIDAEFLKARLQDSLTSAMIESNKIGGNSENKYVLQANEELNKYLVEMWDLVVDTHGD